MQITEKYIKDLKPYESNPRDNGNAVDFVAESIRNFGFKVPIVIDRDNVIVAGHTRYDAAKLLKLEKVPCVVADDLTEEQANAFRLADNKVKEFSQWDYEKLHIELQHIDFPMETFGFKNSDIQNMDTEEMKKLVFELYEDVPEHE